MQQRTTPCPKSPIGSKHGFFGFTATDARGRGQEPRLHRTQSDETPTGLRSTLKMTNTTGSAVVPVKCRCQRTTMPRRWSRVCPRQIAYSPKPKMSSLPGERVARRRDENQVFNVSTATCLTRLLCEKKPTGNMKRARIPELGSCNGSRATARCPIRANGVLATP